VSGVLHIQLQKMPCCRARKPHHAKTVSVANQVQELPVPAGREKQRMGWLGERDCYI
jgi:hypothetical protein